MSFYENDNFIHVFIVFNPLGVGCFGGFRGMVFAYFGYMLSSSSEPSAQVSFCDRVVVNLKVS